MQISSTFTDSNKFFVQNGVVRYFCPGTSYLAKLKHGLSLDSVLYNEYKASCSQPIRLVCDEDPQDELPEESRPVSHEEYEDEPEDFYDPYEENDETSFSASRLCRDDNLFSKCRTTRRPTKMSKTQFLGLAKPRKSVYVPKSSKKVYLVSRDTKSWHQGEYARTNPDKHDDYCECVDCTWIRDEKMMWEDYEDYDGSDWDCWSNYTAELLRQNDFDDIENVVDGTIIL